MILRKPVLIVVWRKYDFFQNRLMKYFESSVEKRIVKLIFLHPEQRRRVVLGLNSQRKNLSNLMNID